MSQRDILGAIMRAILQLLLLTLPLLAQPAPPRDSRNTSIPGTDTHFAAPSFASLDSLETRKAALRKQILFAAGLCPMPERSPLRPRFFNHLEREGYSIDAVLLETMPGYYLGGNLYRPRGKTGKFPGVAAPHGHWKNGRLEHQELASTPGRSINMALQGYVVFAYDMVGWNDTKQTPHDFGDTEEQLWGFGPLGLQLWNSIRVVDFLTSLPEVDPERIGATGASGGGTQTFLLEAVDDRLKFSAPVNMVSAIMQGGSYCENAPGLRAGTNNVEIAAMMAPRPMLLVAATGDWTRNVPKEEFPAIQAIYRLYDKGDNVAAVQFDSPHNYHQGSRETVYRFFARHALRLPNADELREQPFEVPPPEQMLALAGRSLPDGALTYAQLFNQWKVAASRRLENIREPEQLRELLALAIKAAYPRDTTVQEQAGQVVFSRPGAGDRVPGRWFPGRGKAVLIVHEGGSEAGLRSAEAASLRADGRPVLLIDAFQTGAAVAPRDRSHRHFLTFNLSDDACRVQDILTVLPWLARQSDGPVELTGIGRGAVWALFAAALSDQPLKLSAKLGGFQGSDQDFIEKFFVPGVQRAGGLRAALRLTESMRAAN